MADRIVVRGAREHNLKNIDVDDPARQARGDHRAVGLGQVVARLRHHLRRGPAALRRVAVGLRAAVPRADGEAGRRLDRGSLAGDLDRAEDDQPQPALDRRHGHRDLRLPAAALRARRHAALLQCGKPITAQTVQQIVDRVLALPERRAHPRAGADRARSQGRVPQGAARAAQGGLRARAHRRRAARPRRGHRPGTKTHKHTIEVVVDRLVVRDGIAKRLADSLETAFRYGGDLVKVELLPADGGAREAGAASGRRRVLPRSASTCSRRSSPARTAASRSPSSRRACSRSTARTAPARPATAWASSRYFDPDLVVPDDSLSLCRRRDRAVGQASGGAQAAARRRSPRCSRSTLDTPYGKLPEACKDALLHGTGKTPIQLSFERGGRYEVRAPVRRRAQAARAPLQRDRVRAAPRGAARLP